LEWSNFWRLRRALWLTRKAERLFVYSALSIPPGQNKQGKNERLFVYSTLYSALGE
jgi:hypothetical protein